MHSPRDLFFTYTKASNCHKRKGCDSILIEMPKTPDIEDIANDAKLTGFCIIVSLTSLVWAVG